MIGVPALEYWASSPATWVAGMSFLLASILCTLEIREAVSAEPPHRLKAILSGAVLVSVLLSWWAAALQEEQQAPRYLTESQEQQIVSFLRARGDPPPEIAVYYSDDLESRTYARQWEDVLRRAGWKLIEEGSMPTHASLTVFRGVQIEVLDEGRDSVDGAPATLAIAMQSIGVPVEVLLRPNLRPGYIELSIGSK